MNEYEDSPRSRMEISESSKTEDVYQTLQKPPSVKNPNLPHEPVRSRGVKMKLLVFNTLLLISILILIGVFTARKQPRSDVNKPQVSAAENQRTVEVSRADVAGEAEGEELWRLHSNKFYLFWEAEGSCTNATKFCEDRNSRIGTVTDENKDWILSQANGRKLWADIEGVTAGHLNETLYQCGLDEDDSGISEDVQGWVCASRQLKSTTFLFPEISPRFFHHFIEDESDETSEMDLTDYFD